MPNDENSNTGDFTTDLSVATLNVNSLYKAENIEHVAFNKKIKRNDRRITLKKGIITQQQAQYRFE